MMEKFGYTVNAELGTVGRDKKLRLVTWEGHPCKLDFRRWRDNEDGTEQCGKGISFSDDEAKVLLELLTKYLESRQQN